MYMKMITLYIKCFQMQTIDFIIKFFFFLRAIQKSKFMQIKVMCYLRDVHPAFLDDSVEPGEGEHGL